MRRALALACLAGLLVYAAADLEIQQLEEDTSTPGVTGGTYAIVQDGQVVGLVEHYRSEGGFGRRGGPSDDRAPTPAALRLAELLTAQADALAELRDRLMAMRCHAARQMALARLALAASAAAGGEEDGSVEGASVPGFPGTGMMMGEGHEHGHHHAHGHGLMMAGEQAHRGHVQAMMLRRPSRDAEPRVPRVNVQPAAATSQDPADHPEDIVDLETAQERLFGPASGGDAAEEPTETAGATVTAADSEQLSEEERVAQETAAAAAAAGGFLMPRVAEQTDAEANSVAGAGGMPLMFRTAQPEGMAAMEGEQEAADEELAGVAMEEEAAAGAEAEPVPLAALVWAHIQRTPIPRMPVHGGPMHHTHHGPMPLMERRPSDYDPYGMEEGMEPLVEVAPGKWVPLSEAVAMADAAKPEMDWNLFSSDGSLNWGLVTFVGLAVACTAVWGAMLVQWATYRSARDNANAAAYFIKRVDADQAASLKPLLHEGPLKGGVVGVEEASAHVAGGQRSVTVLHYEPLKSSDA